MKVMHPAARPYILALSKEFNLKLNRVGAGWLDVIDYNPDPNNPEHWEELYLDEKRSVYFNFRFFPTIYVENVHNVSTIGKIVVRKDVDVERVLWYFHNILDAQ
jgi:hypothetical protein